MIRFETATGPVFVNPEAVDSVTSTLPVDGQPSAEGDSERCLIRIRSGAVYDVAGSAADVAEQIGA